MQKQAIVFKSHFAGGSVRSALNAMPTLTVGELRKAVEGVPDDAYVLTEAEGLFRALIMDNDNTPRRVWQDEDGEWREW